MQKFSFIVSLVLALLTLIAVLIKIPVRLEVMLTKDAFFRILDWGDSIFMNVLYLARNGNILIEKAKAELTRTGGSVKTYPLSIIKVGEKIPGNYVEAAHSFYSSSPVAFVPNAKPLRLLYLCTIDGYSETYSDAHNAFIGWAASLANSNPPEKRAAMTEGEVKQLFDEINSKTQEFVSAAMENVQLETGTHSLRITIIYRRLGLLGFRKQKSSSSIRFVVPQAVRLQIRNDLLTRYRNTVYTMLGTQLEVRYPDYVPTEIVEGES